MKTIIAHHELRYQAPDISPRELSLSGFLCSSEPLATCANLDPWIEETADEDIVLIQDR